ncbi:zinc finger and SCAN domain-containing protein 12-like [Contarinia nasturtii]|uniref:zinc finger and SCAN domain-containing protein 12-like n=1 Tax=Contarinia nasturtii TaxID=265458 RepID=UPI0012D3D295|nr:zinc finger and SCAN domain-containing protein 12-like [Contarinia nasturtii]
MNIKIDINLCRVCKKEEPGSNIYTGNILEKFLYTTLVQVEKNDGLSEIICKKCLARLQIAYDFKRQAVESHRELRSFISNVNKQFKQVTGTKTKQKDGESESYDELEDDMQAIIDDEVEYKEIDVEFSDDTKKAIDREQLVEILGENNAITIRKTRAVKIQEDANNEAPENMEVYLVEEGHEGESGFILDEYDENGGELIVDDVDYLEDDDIDDLYETEEVVQTKRTTSRANRSSSSVNADNRCNICQKTFSTRTNLTRHKITHEGRKPYVCRICGSSFTQNGSLKCHMFIHTGERPYKCDQCDKAFTQSKSLVFHKRRHTGEKPFPCDVCGIQFRQKDGLKRHIAAKHAAQRTKNHICHICDKVLLSRHSLKAHLTRHNDKDIEEKFNQLEKLHKANSTDPMKVAKTENEKIEDSETPDDWDELFACEFCDQAFSNSNELLEHRETHNEAQE